MMVVALAVITTGWIVPLIHGGEVGSSSLAVESMAVSQAGLAVVGDGVIKTHETFLSLNKFAPARLEITGTLVLALVLAILIAMVPKPTSTTRLRRPALWFGPLVDLRRCLAGGIV